MIEKKFVNPSATRTFDLKLSKTEWEEGYPFSVKWYSTYTGAYSKAGFKYWEREGTWNVRFYCEEIEAPPEAKSFIRVNSEYPPGTPYEVSVYIDGKNVGSTGADGIRTFEVTPGEHRVVVTSTDPAYGDQVKVGSIGEGVTLDMFFVVKKAEYKYKVLPKPPAALKKENYDLYEELDRELAAKNISGVLSILRKMLDRENSPTPVLAIILAVTSIVAIILEAIGTYNFASFMMEEALQTIDMAIYQASKDGNWDLMAKALAKKNELLDITWLEALQAKVPFLNVAAAQQKFFETSQIKYQIDLESWKRKEEASTVNTNVNLELAAKMIEEGKDPYQYLPTAETVSIPEVISGEVVSVIDGDTIEVKDMLGHVFRVRLIGIDAPEFKTTEGKASGKFLTDQIHAKRVNVKVDPNNQKDEYGRVLGTVFLNSTDINKLMLTKGYANYYFIGSSKYYSDDDYKEAAKRRGKVTITSKPTYCKIWLDQKDTLKLTTQTFELPEGTYVIGASKEGYRAETQTITVIPDETVEIRFELEATGLGEEEEEVPKDKIPEKVEFKIYITSTPSNAKLYIDDEYTHHWTPANEKELKDVLELLTVGSHKIKVTKGGMMAEKEVMIVEGDNGTIDLKLETVGLPPEKPPTPEEEPTVPTPEVPADLKALFNRMLEMTEGRLMITRKEVEDLMIEFGVS